MPKASCTHCDDRGYIKSPLNGGLVAYHDQFHSYELTKCNQCKHAKKQYTSPTDRSKLKILTDKYG